MEKINKIYKEVKIIFHCKYILILYCKQRHLTTSCYSFMAAFLGNSTGGVCVLKLKVL
jgi:hypothetical protein